MWSVLSVWLPAHKQNKVKSSGRAQKGTSGEVGGEEHGMVSAQTHAVEELAACLQALLLERTPSGSLAQHHPHFERSSLKTISRCENDALAALGLVESIEEELVSAMDDVRRVQLMDRAVVLDASLFGHSVFFPSLASVFAHFAHCRSSELLESSSVTAHSEHIQSELRELLHSAFLPWTPLGDPTRRAQHVVCKEFGVDLLCSDLLSGGARFLNPHAHDILDIVRLACEVDKTSDFSKIVTEYQNRLRMFKGELQAALSTVETSNNFWITMQSLLKDGCVKRSASRVLRLPVGNVVSVVAHTSMRTWETVVGCDASRMAPLLDEIFNLFVATRMTPSPSTSTLARMETFGRIVRSLPLSAFESEVVIHVSELEQKAKNELARLAESRTFCRLTKRSGNRVFAINGPELKRVFAL